VDPPKVIGVDCPRIQNNRFAFGWLLETIDALHTEPVASFFKPIPGDSS